MNVQQAVHLVFDNLFFDGSQVRNSVIKLDIGSDYLTIQNSRIVGNAAGNGILMGNTHTIIGNEISGAGGYGIYHTGHDSLIAQNCIHDNHGFGVHVYQSGSGEVSNNVVRHNVILHNGWDNANPAGSCGMVLASGEGNVAEGNLVAGSFGCGIQLYVSAVGTRVSNNTLLDNRGGPTMDAGRDTVMQGNTTTGTAPTACGTWRPAPTLPAPRNLHAVRVQP
jgi:parallel beta-helix repeat protein